MIKDTDLIQNLDEDTQDELPNEDYKLQYNPEVAGVISYAKTHEAIRELDLSKVPLKVAIKDVDKLSPEEFTMSRREGFGCSDSSVLLGVNPYQTLDEIIQQKARKTLTKEEKAVSKKVAVRKGNDLEPLVIKKASEAMGQEIIKPADTYEYIPQPIYKVNFDGVVNGSEYIPCEIKVATKYGARHYNPAKALFSEYKGWGKMPSQSIINANATIEEKAGFFGIPPYYYTQVQAEMLALNAPYGYLAALFDNDWIMHIWMIWADHIVQAQFLYNMEKAWAKVLELRKQNGWYDTETKNKKPEEY